GNVGAGNQQQEPNGGLELKPSATGFASPKSIERCCRQVLTGVGSRMVRRQSARERGQLGLGDRKRYPASEPCDRRVLAIVPRRGRHVFTERNPRVDVLVESRRH